MSSWTFLSHHAQVLLCISRDPDARLREIAADRLLVGHNVDLDRQPERSRRLLGAEVWQLVRPAIGGDEAAGWKAMSVQRLQQAIQALEVV